MRSDRSDRPLVVWRAGVYWDAVTGTDRQLVTHLAEWVDVLWVDPPCSITSRPSAATLRPRCEAVIPGVRRLTVTAPPLAMRRGVVVVTEGLVGAAVRAVLRRDGRQPAGVVGTAPFASLRLGPSRRLYYATDDFVAGSSLIGHSEQRLLRAEAARLLEATVAGSVSARVVARWDADIPTFVMPNGCDTSHYRDVDRVAPALDHVPGRRTAGLVGHLSPRIDLALLEAVAATPLHLLMVGPRVDGWGGARFDSLVAQPNVTWVGPQPYESLPSYLQVVDVGLTPYADTAFNRASSPLKTLEYLAAGRPAVSTDLPAARGLAPDCVTTATSGQEFADAAVRLAATSHDLRDACRAEAERHSWRQRALELLDSLGLPQDAEVRSGAR